MGLEIERKFLVASEAWRQHVGRSLPMHQGYLGDESGRASVRVRLEGAQARLNIKAAVVGAARAEYEYAIPPPDAVEMLERLCIGRLDKARHYVEVGAHIWEVDEFFGDNAGLVVAEIELQRIDEAFQRPDWLGREVTDDRRYYNHHLALHPYRSWAHEA